MKTKRTRWWPKSAALLCATVFGLTAFGGTIYEWTPVDGGTTYWDDNDNWVESSADATDWRIGNNGAEVTFRSAVSLDDENAVLVYNGTHSFVAAEDGNGLAKENAPLNVVAPWWYTGDTVLNITSGAYTFASVNINTNVTYGGSATLTLNGGTLAATSVTGTGTLAIGENGGTFANGENATVSATLSGSGTLTKTGTGTLTITGSISAFKGKIAVAAEAGSVIVGDITIAAGEEVQFGVYTWTGAGTAVEPEEEGGETTYTDADLWSNVNNWLVNGSIPATAPAADSTVVIPEGDGSELTVRCNGTNGDCTGYLTINRDVKFARVDSSHTGMRITAVYGEGKTLAIANNFTLWCAINGVQPEISANLNIGNNTLTLANGGSGSNKFGSAIKLTGAFLSGGRGSVTCSTQVGGLGLEFYGDTSEFYGTYNGSGFKNGSNEYIDGTRFGAAIDGSNANWSFGQKHEHNNNGNWTPFLVGNATYKFGSINSISDCFTFCSYHKSTGDTFTENVTVEFGSKGDSTIKGDIRGTGNKLVKVGASTKADITLTTTGGEIDAQEGTVSILGTVAPAAVKFSGTGATIKIARSTTTTTEVDSGVEDDESTTDVDESKTTTTTTTDNIAASFVPTFIDDFAGYQYSVAQETADDVTYDVYTVVKVAKDSSDTEYYSVAEAITALAEAEDKTITLIANYDTAVALPLGYSLVMSGFTANVSGVSGVAVEYNEETGTYTTVDNSSATWQGAAAGANWADAANWSTGAIPDAGTAVSFTYNALVYISDHDNLAHKCASMDIANNVTVEFAPPNKDYTIYPRVAVYGNINGGKGTLKLWRSGIIEQADGYVDVYPAVQFENPGFYEGQTRDSWFQGNFTFRGDVTGTGVLVIYDACTFNYANINVPEGSVVDFRANPTLSHADEKLTGTGTVIVHATPANGRWKSALQNSTNWQGVTEVQGEINGIDAANFGGTGSTVRFNGVTGYLRYSSGSTTEVGKVKTIEIGANGLTLNNGFSNQGTTTFGYIIAADITGSGPIHFGTKHQTTAVGQYFLTGSLDGFTGAIDFGSLDSYRPAVIIKDPTTYAPAVNDFGQIIVAAERTVTVSGAWNAPGGIVVLGKVNVASTGSLTSTNGLCGNGTVAYEAIPANTTTLTFCAGGTSSGTGREIPAWTGSVELPATVISAKTGIPLPGLSSDNGKLVVKGITRSTASNSIYLGTGAACTMKGTVQLDGDLYITDGNSNVTYTWNKITGSGAFFVTTAGGSASGITHAVTTLDNYAGTITAGGNVSLTIGTVAVDAVEVGVPVVKLAANSNLTTDPAAIALEVAGEASELTLVKADDGNLYVAVASVTVTPEEGDPVTTPFATYEAAAAFADENSVNEFAVLYGDGAVNGWDYNSETGKLTKNAAAIARVGTTNYNSLEAAFAAAGEDDTVVLFGTSAENVTVGEGQTLVVEGAYTGTLSGFGTVDAKVATTPAGFSSWTGTFVLDWDASAANDNTAWELNKYGVSGSTVVIAQPIAKGYFKAPVTGSNLHSIAPAVYLKANVSITNGYANNNNQDQTTTFAELGADEGVTFSFRYLAGAAAKDTTVYAITKLSNFAGTLVLNAYNQVTIGSVDVEVPAFGTKVVNATIADTASLTGKIAEGYPLVAKEDGLYFDPVAQVGEAYYNTLADAVTAANGATVALVKSTTDGVVVAAGQTVVIKFGEYSTGDIAAATDYILNTSWDDATKTGTYTTTAVAAYLTVGETVTPYTVPFTALTDFIASAAGSTLRFVGTNPFADTAVPCASYDADTLTYTKLAAVAQIGTGVSVIQYPTLAEACAAAEQSQYDTVTLLVAKDSIEEELPEGWDYNDPETSGTDYGTLTKEMTVTYNVWFVDTDLTTLAPYQTVESGATATKPEDPVKKGKVFVAWTLNNTAYDFATPVTADITLIASWEDAPTGTEASDGSGNTFTVPATVATPANKTLTDAATGTINYAQAYALGLWDGTAEGEVAEPTVSINIVNGEVQVAFVGGTVPEAYTVTTILQYKATLGTTSEWQNVEGDGATGALGATLVDQSEMGANKFYRVIVTITDKQLVSEEVETGTGA